MRLADFILSNTETILNEWDVFAREVWPNEEATQRSLRDHAGEILRATARDMKSEQTPEQQSDKSHGNGDAGKSSVILDSASKEHASGRVTSGFSLPSLVAEYRALRASVVRLWAESGHNPDSRDLADLTRFNESIDQSLAEAVRGFTDQVDQARQMFLAILGHDLRNPLNAIMLSAQILRDERTCSPSSSEVILQIASSGDAMARMLNDFLDFAGTQLGKPMPVSPAPTDLAAVCTDVIKEISTANPSRKFRQEVHGDITGEWDAARLRQLLSNLLGNAVQHGSAATVIEVDIKGEASDVVLSVRNEGSPIPTGLLPRVFEPLVSGYSPDARAGRRNGSMGLGLYIAREVVTAHGGRIEVKSSDEDGTVFTVKLPRERADLDTNTERSQARAPSKADPFP